MLSRSLIFFLLILIPPLPSTSILALSQQPKYNLLPRVHIINSLPPKSEPANVECKSRNTDMGERDLNVGDEFVWNAKERSLYYCQAFWGRYFASWHGVQPKRDHGKAEVFWLVKDRGFYLSWDNSTWLKKSVWQTE